MCTGEAPFGEGEMRVAQDKLQEILTAELQYELVGRSVRDVVCIWRQHNLTLETICPDFRTDVTAT